MVTVFNGNILSLDDVVNKIITGREALKAGLDPKVFRKPVLIDEKGNVASNIIRQKKMLYNSVLLKPSTLEGPRPIMYMILRPWVKNMKEFTISSSHKPYLGELAHVDTTQWYYPTDVFYEASTHPGSQNMIDGHKVRIRYETLDGKIFEQDKEIFDLEKRFFETSPMYDVPFLERAFSRLSLSVLDNHSRSILETMAKNILSSAFGRIMNSYYNLSLLSEKVLQSILQASVTIENFFDNIYKVVWRLDTSICPVAVLHKNHHRRLRNFLYELSNLHNLTNGLAFYEMSLMSSEDQLMISNTVKVSREIFYIKSINNFKSILYPTLRFQTLKKRLPPRPPFVIDYNVKEEYFFYYMLPKNPEVLHLDAVAKYEDDENPIVKQTEKYFDLDYVTYMGQLGTSLFCTYPVYYSENPLALTATISQASAQASQAPQDDFWDKFEAYLLKKEYISPGKKPDIVTIHSQEIEEEDDEEAVEEVDEEFEEDEQPFDEDDLFED